MNLSSIRAQLNALKVGASSRTTLDPVQREVLLEALRDEVRKEFEDLCNRLHVSTSVTRLDELPADIQADPLAREFFETYFDICLAKVAI